MPTSMRGGSWADSENNPANGGLGTPTRGAVGQSSGIPHRFINGVLTHRSTTTLANTT